MLDSHRDTCITCEKHTSTMAQMRTALDTISCQSTTRAPSQPRRPDRDPPRNERGDIICLHQDCSKANPIFKRPCEYNKHMDRHERPYKCEVPSCEQTPGFTYSGGLLRHQREVHKMCMPKRPLFCPHSNCTRSFGVGFTRKENLDEHLRRRHSAMTNDGSSPVTVYTPTTSRPIEPLPQLRKRPRDVSDDYDGSVSTNSVDGGGGGGGDEASEASSSNRLPLVLAGPVMMEIPEVKLLRQEMDAKDQEIALLRREVQRLQSLHGLR